MERLGCDDAGRVLSDGDPSSRLIVGEKHHVTEMFGWFAPEVAGVAETQSRFAQKSGAFFVFANFRKVQVFGGN